ncbi:hypothetical protein C5167_012003 [Papaver somniferum]|uniref:Uncharacterized protein n=1 Tax=Papaver somniferum TaxID=3469 RepID=A0A4Y7IW82_PAPSO|nr:hypothetical protein C5167_012003 [Papaver somniferum]
MNDSRTETPFVKAGLFSRLSFWWLNPLIKKGKHRNLEDDDIPMLRNSDRASTCYMLFMQQQQQLILWAIVHCYWKEIVVSGLFALLKIIILSSGPLFLSAFIKVAEGKEDFKHEGYVLAGLLFFSKLLESLSQRQWYFRSRITGIRIRSLLSAAIYKKQFKLSSSAKTTNSASEIISYVTVDAYRIGEFSYWFHQIWTLALQVCLGLAILVRAVGLATLAALAVILLTVLVNIPVAKLQTKYQRNLMGVQDKRLKAISEALVNMKILKLYAWEIHFKNVIEKLRNDEYKRLSPMHYQKAFNGFLFWVSPVMVAAATFWACYFLKVPLNPSNVFTFIATLRIVQDPIRLFPDLIGVVIQAKVSFERIEKFLAAPELETDKVRHKGNDEEQLKNSIFIETGNFSWEESLVVKYTLRNINLEVKPGEKVAICGEVGAGKSTLLAAILGEVPNIKGTIQVNGKMAYVSQTAWIQSGSIQENILFGCSLDKKRYQEVLERCSLLKDLEMLPYGDLTEIGERGINLSGGQKQRIQLARALYQDADVYLLDDPFSAVDAHTATSLFNEYVMGALSGKTVLLVTHQVDFLPAVDYVLLMSDGEIQHASPYHTLLASSSVFYDLVNAHKDTAGNEKLTKVDSSQRIGISARDAGKIYGDKETKESAGHQLIRKEERETGNTGWKPCFSAVALSMHSSKSLFSKLLDSLFRAPISFYESTPLGRLLSRVSSDLSTVDLDLGFIFIHVIVVTANFYITLGVLTVITWQVVFVCIPMAFSVIYLQGYYSASAKEFMRINGTTKSMIANHLGESIAGAMTIRAFQNEERFFLRNLELIDKNASPSFYIYSANEWFIQRLETLSVIVLCSSALLMVLLPQGTFSSGFIGMALSYGLSLNMSLVFSTQNQCALANNIISVERLSQYMNILSEAPEVIEGNRPAPSWPAVGRVEFHDLKIRYRVDTPLVLQGITCTFEGGHKIGIVGRTGSGKTTLISALFRIVEPFAGKIVIDDIDISTIGLHDLRTRLGIIPQDPTLFKGTVRYNLDPLSQHSDHEIWEVLDKCQLRDTVQEKKEGLCSLVEQDGGNWSMGQRQLFCLGRALLKRSQILVLDEATASIDNATDSILQRTIRTEFESCTVITVAHRIPTVMDSTMVLAIGDGKIVEYDEPTKLMNEDGSLFGELDFEKHKNATSCITLSPARNQ